MFRDEKFVEKVFNKQLEYTELKPLSILDLLKEEDTDSEDVIEYFLRQKDDIYIDQYLEMEDEFMINSNNKSQPVGKSGFESVYESGEKTPYPIQTKKRRTPDIISNLITHKQFEDIYDNMTNFPDDIKVELISDVKNKQISPYSKEFHLVTENIQYMNYIIRFLYKQEYFKYLFIFCRKLLNNLELHVYCNFEKEIVLELDKLPGIKVDIEPFNKDYYYYMKFGNFIIKELIKEI